MCSRCQVILEWEYVMLCVRLKLLDVLLGFWVWAGIGWSWLGSQPYRYVPLVLPLFMFTLHVCSECCATVVMARLTAIQVHYYMCTYTDLHIH